jgi:hypothetical protein
VIISQPAGSATRFRASGLVQASGVLAKNFSDAKEPNDEDNTRLKPRKRATSKHRRVFASVSKVLHHRHGIFFGFIK